MIHRQQIIFQVHPKVRGESVQTLHLYEAFLRDKAGRATKSDRTLLRVETKIGTDLPSLFRDHLGVPLFTSTGEGTANKLEEQATPASETVVSEGTFENSLEPHFSALVEPQAPGVISLDGQITVMPEIIGGNGDIAADSVRTKFPRTVRTKDGFLASSELPRGAKGPYLSLGNVCKWLDGADRVNVGVLPVGLDGSHILPMSARDVGRPAAPMLPQSRK